MPKITKIYTRQGDDGSTALGTNRRVPKDDARIDAYGTVDELNSVIGLALAQCLSPRLGKMLAEIQNELFHLGSDLAFPPDDPAKTAVPRIEPRHIDRLEQWIDELNQQVGPLENFILPGGAPGAAALQVARAVCRRAERITVGLSAKEEVNPVSLKYLNRLSDALFVMARFENKEKNIEEPIWDSRA
ncbi:MAG: cob(I)yrinic acid a,c-diamide adenosyltransferase [Anaerolineae bacterium]|nr:cob(I)yrinic acid a,c-diamide adenosyltransferase [Anaerolineae bacterium]